VVSSTEYLATPTADGDAVPGIVLKEVPPFSILFLAQPIEGPVLAAVKSILGSAPALPSVGATVGAGPVRLLGIGPNRYLLVREADVAVASTLAPAFAISTELTDAWTRIRISGPATLELLAKGSALDLDAGSFTPGSCAGAPFAQMPTILHRADDRSFDLYVGRSYALSMLEWLNDAAAEFGCGKI
jgi:sarcosine oxidase subunit gamma